MSAYVSKIEGAGWPCSEPGCAKSGHGKPACPDHIARLPYVAQLVRDVARGAVNTVSVECGNCGEHYDRERNVKTKPVCASCRRGREAESHRRRHAKKRAS